MMIAVCDLFLAPKGIASSGGHGNSVANFEMSVSPTDRGANAFVGWFLEEPADFFGSTSGVGGLALSYVNVPGVKSSGL
tara:strand:- start:485 stop:721 length:237 start_codon:yes stop_codon:yes gene_type:complete